MKKHIKIDHEARISYKKLEYNYIFLKTILKNLNLKKNKNIIKNSQFILYTLKIKKTKIQNYCCYTGRSHGVYSFTKLSRMQSRVLNTSNLIPGFQKCSW
jgi:ribosomal protein S14